MEFWNSLFGLVCSVITVTVFVCTIAFLIAKGKLMDAMEDLLDDKFTEREKRDEKERSLRQEKYMGSITTIINLVEVNEQQTKAYNKSVLESIKDIKDQINSNAEKMDKNTVSVAQHEIEIKNIKDRK